MNQNYKLYKDSGLSEAQIESDVASYLGYITPFWSKRYRLKAVNEQLTGADKLFDRFVPLYLQFKVSEGLKPLADGFTLSSPNRPLQRIRTFRKDNNISCDPTLYFRLRDKAKNATEFQHNLLLSLNDPPNQHAFYVAPLTLSIDEYNKSLEVSTIDRLVSFDPFYMRDESIYLNSVKKRIGLIPFLRGHISIAPHEKITTSEHYYSFSKAGTNVAWHSGEKFIGDFRLSTQIDQIFRYAYNKDYTFNSEQFVNFIEQFSKSNNLEFDEYESLERTIYNFAYTLKSEHNIQLFILETDSSANSR